MTNKEAVIQYLEAYIRKCKETSTNTYGATTIISKEDLMIMKTLLEKARS